MQGVIHRACLSQVGCARTPSRTTVSSVSQSLWSIIKIWVAFSGPPAGRKHFLKLVANASRISSCSSVKSATNNIIHQGTLCNSVLHMCVLLQCANCIAQRRKNTCKERKQFRVCSILPYLLCDYMYALGSFDPVFCRTIAHKASEELECVYLRRCDEFFW